jgi:hypothetical protein
MFLHRLSCFSVTLFVLTAVPAAALAAQPDGIFFIPWPHTIGK